MLTLTLSTPRRLFVVACALLVGTPSAASAQANPDSVHSRNDCRLAAQIIRTGQPANKSDWAYGFIPNCGSSATTLIAELWRANETGTDSTLLFKLRRSVLHLADGELFATFLHTAGSPTASERARIEAWRYLFRFSNPGAFLSDSELAVTPIDQLCSVTYFTIGDPVVVSPLPAGFRDQMDQVALQVATGSSTLPVRRFASCVHQFVEFSRTNP